MDQLVNVLSGIDKHTVPQINIIKYILIKCENILIKCEDILIKCEDILPAKISASSIKCVVNKMVLSFRIF